MKEQLKDLVSLLQQSEAQRKDLIKEQKMREQAVAIALCSSASVRLCLTCIIIYSLCCSYSKDCAINLEPLNCNIHECKSRILKYSITLAGHIF